MSASPPAEPVAAEGSPLVHEDETMAVEDAPIDEEQRDEEDHDNVDDQAQEPADDEPAAEEPADDEPAVGDKEQGGGIYDDVFGDGSDDDDEAPRRRKDTGDDDEGEGDTYAPATATSAARIPSFKKRGGGSGAPSGEEGGDDGEDEERRRKKKKKKERRSRPDVEEDEEEEPVLDDATRRRLALEERIENIGKKSRTQRRKRKGGEDVDIVDSYHDEVCIRLRDRMMAAAAKDINANNNKLPATSKLGMLDEVVGALQNTTLWSSIIDNEVLKAVKQWLEPLPDRSLPAVGIQKAIFEVLPKMDLDTPTIREAGLGPVVLFYTKTKRVTPAITRQADALVQSWSRPIIKRSADYRNKQVLRAHDVERADDEEEMYDEEGEPKRRKVSKAKPRRFDVRKAVAENATRKGARLPVVNDVQYTVAPESRMQHQVEDLQYVSRIQMDNKKFNRFARQLKGGGRRQ